VHKNVDLQAAQEFAASQSAMPSISTTSCSSSAMRKMAGWRLIDKLLRSGREGRPRDLNRADATCGRMTHHPR